MNQKIGITIFFSYAETDQAWCEQLSTHLSQLKRDGMIREWHYQQILAGSDARQETDQALRSADIILLLISADFLASDARYQREMQHALDRHRTGVARVIPIIVRPCDWQHSPFAYLQCLPRNTKPVSTWENQDEAFRCIAQELRRILAHQQFPPSALSNMQRQNCTRLLKRVRATWIKGLLEHSLHQAAWIDLHLQEQPDALDNPWRFQVQELNCPPRALPVGTSIVAVYDEADGQLLILGEPGAGKTTLLLQLARTLLDRAEADERQPMPVVFNLSSWAQRQETLAMWLVEELRKKYQVSRQVAQDWVEAHQILPLLDGLDEVATEARVACVQAITAYYSRDPNYVGGIPLVTCCRSKEYQELALHLPLSRAVSILPLTEEQIDAYLSSTKGQLEGLRHLLHTDTHFVELAHTPLMLSIIALAFQGKHLIKFPSENNFPGTSQEQILQFIWATYVERMLSHRKQLSSWTKRQFLSWLVFVAKQLYQRQQSVLLVEDLQPDWLPQKLQRSYRWSIGLLLGLGIVMYGEIVWIMVYWLFPWLLTGIIRNPTGGLIGLLPLGLFEGVSCGLFFGLWMIRPFDGLTWSRAGIWHRIPVALLFCIGGAGLVLFSKKLRKKIAGNQPSEHSSTTPNERIQRSAKNGMLTALLSVPLIGIIFGLAAMLHALAYYGPNIGLIMGLLEVLFAGLFLLLPLALLLGLGAFVQHYVLRFWLWRANCLPRKLVPFLDEATERLLLRRVGGGYIFVHRLLLEYFAALDEPASIDRMSTGAKENQCDADTNPCSVIQH